MSTASVSEHEFRVLDNEQAARGIWRAKIATPVAKDIAPGQFMNLRVPGNDAHILRIPLSFARADAESQTVELIYAVVGEGTRRLSEMAPGATSTLVGPSGRGWQLPKTEGRALVVAGGVGLPPILACAEMLERFGIGFDAVVGARTYEMHVHPEVERLSCGVNTGADPDRIVILTTDDGTQADGSVGRGMYATDAMAELLGSRSYTQVYTCGPTVMMAGVARLAREHGISCQTSLERMMGCGFGACSCCNVALANGGYALCCQDGPVFDAEEVAW